MGKRQYIQQELLGNLDSYMQISEARTGPHTMHKDKLKMTERPQYKTRHHQTPGREYRQNTLWTSTLQMFSQFSLPYLFGFFVMIFIFSIIAGLQCSVNFLLYSKVTQLYIHVYILFSYIIVLYRK